MANSDSDQEKTLPATPRRLEQAREEGQVPRSRALASALTLGLAACAFVFMGPHLTASMQNILRRGLSFDHAIVLNDASMTDRLSGLLWPALMIGVPLCVVVTMGALIAPFLLGGILYSSTALEPKWSRIDPIAGFQRMVSGQNLAELAKTIIEAIVVLSVIGVFIWRELGHFGSVLEPSQHGPLSMLTEIVLAGFVLIVVAIAATALLDVPLQLWRHAQTLRMTEDEVRREGRETDGDPHLKARIRQLQRETAKKRMMGEVPKANVVITNPTHFAVALSYQDGASSAPRVVAKGAGPIAQKIRELAAQAGVPLVEAPPLARALYKHAEIGDEIPPTLFTAVAQVLAFVYRLRTEHSALATTPYEIDAVDVPPELDPFNAVSEGLRP